VFQHDSFGYRQRRRWLLGLVKHLPEPSSIATINKCYSFDNNNGMAMAEQQHLLFFIKKRKQKENEKKKKKKKKKESCLIGKRHFTNIEFRFHSQFNLDEWSYGSRCWHDKLRDGYKYENKKKRRQ
jgi:hypothetical protein